VKSQLKSVSEIIMRISKELKSPTIIFDFTGSYVLVKIERLLPETVNVSIFLTCQARPIGFGMITRNNQVLTLLFA
jgi:hypothetical protein